MNCGVDAERKPLGRGRRYRFEGRASAGTSVLVSDYVRQSGYFAENPTQRFAIGDREALA